MKAPEFVPIEVDVIVQDAKWPQTIDGTDIEQLISEAIGTACEQLKISPSPDTELSIVLTSDENQRLLNKKWRHMDRPTNVLSFSQIEPFSRVEGMLGDIILARQTLEREAQQLTTSFADHLTHLVVHGFLHILGYDHKTDTDAVTMETLEVAILARLGIGSPYA